MEQKFIDHLVSKHSKTPEVPSTHKVSDWALRLMEVLFPEVTEKRLESAWEIHNTFQLLQLDLKSLLHNTQSCDHSRTDDISRHFFESLPEIYRKLILDLETFVDGDPAAWNTFEVVRSYPGFFAIYIYRVAHALHMAGVPLIPRILSEYAHSRTGVDIHPASVIGDAFFIDHGTGVVIGETAIVGNNVRLYQGVTLGALSIDKKMAGIKRHPTVEDNVIIYSGATILGGETVIGEGSIIGGNVWLTRSIQPFTKVYHNADNKVIENIT
ncbi:MAG: serine O-acetyltransferase [Saprospiraceae bacterium]